MKHEESLSLCDLRESKTAHNEKAIEKEVLQCYCVQAESIKSSPLYLPPTILSFCLYIISTQTALLG